MKDFCLRCGFNVEIFHVGLIPRKPYGNNEVKYCRPCFDVLNSPNTTINSFDDIRPVVEQTRVQLMTPVQTLLKGFLLGIILGVTTTILVLRYVFGFAIGT